VVVTHGGLIGHVLASWLGSGPADWRRFEVHNCSMSVLEGSDGQWKALALNDTRHLAPELTAQHDSSAWNR
jgi:broad specificity phosphatase PhoE